MSRRLFAASVVVMLLSVSYTAAALPPASFCQRRPDHQHCQPTTTTTAPVTTTTQGATTTTAPTTTATTLPPTTTTTAAPTTTTLPATTTTSPPGGCVGVQVAAGANLVTVANSQPAGTTFCLAAGTYTVSTAIPAETGDRWIGASNRGSILTGNNSATIAFAASSGPNVTLRNLVVERFNSALQHGAVGGARPRAGENDSGWLIDNCEFRFNKAAGIYAGSGWRVTNSFIHHQGQIGIKARGFAAPILFENNEVSFNNVDNVSSGWEAGGSKFLDTDGLTLRGNYVHDNNGQGLWTDSNNIRTLIEGNRVIDNRNEGIFHEISYDAVIRNNEVRGNGVADHPWLYGAGILIAHSPNVEVYGNIVEGNGNGIGVIQQARGTGKYGPWETRNVWVHDNDITMVGGYTGLAKDTGDNTIFTGRNNRFTGNDYHGVGTRGAWEWMNGHKSWAEWQGFGNDLTGSRS